MYAILVEGINYGEHSCEIILNEDQWFKRCCLKKFMYNTQQTRPITIGELKTVGCSFHNNQSDHGNGLLKNQTEACQYIQQVNR